MNCQLNPMTPMPAPTPGWQSTLDAASSGCTAHSLRTPACYRPVITGIAALNPCGGRNYPAGGELSEKAWQP